MTKRDSKIDWGPTIEPNPFPPIAESAIVHGPGWAVLEENGRYILNFLRGSLIEKKERLVISQNEVEELRRDEGSVTEIIRRHFDGHGEGSL